MYLRTLFKPQVVILCLAFGISCRFLQPSIDESEDRIESRVLRGRDFISELGGEVGLWVVRLNGSGIRCGGEAFSFLCPEEYTNG
jgi:hypothetical protein